MMFRLGLFILLTICFFIGMGNRYDTTYERFSPSDSRTFQMHSPLYIRKNGKMCYYPGKVTSLPTATVPYYTVQYTNGRHNPNGKAKCTESIHKDEFYTRGGDTIRDRKRVLRNTIRDVRNKAFVENRQVGHPIDAFCYPRKMTTVWNLEYPQNLPPAIDLKQTHYQLVSTLLNTLYSHTYLNVFVKDVNSAPSIVSDQHAHPEVIGAAPRQDMYLDYNGCRPYAPQADSHLAVHPKACSMRYQLRQPQPLEMHLLGSDRSGSSLYIFQQIVHALNNTIIVNYGANGVLKGYIDSLTDRVLNYESYRKRVSLGQLQKAFHHLLNTDKPGTGELREFFTREDTLMDAVLPQRTTASATPVGQQPFHRMYLLPMIRAHRTSTAFVSDHDATISVGRNNTDITAEVSFSAKQSTTTTRFAFHPDADNEQMCTNTLNHPNIDARDRYYLSVWLHLLCASIVPQVLQTIAQPVTKRPVPSSSPPQGLAKGASAHIILAVQQLFALLTDAPMNTMTSDPLFGQLQSATSKQTPHIVKQLFNKHVNKSAYIVHKAEWEHQHIVSPHRSNRRDVNVRIPWNALVFGVTYVPHHEVYSKYKIEPVLNTPTNCVFNIQKVHNGSTPGWPSAVVVHMNKRIQVHRVLPDNFMNRLLIGNYHFENTAYQHLNEAPLFGAFPENIRASYNKTYYNDMKYKSHEDGKCYTVKCLADTTTPRDTHNAQRACCTNEDDVSHCPMDVREEVLCVEPLRPTPSSSSPINGRCHTMSYSAQECEQAFSTTIQNCRNGLLIIEPDDPNEGLTAFWNYLTHPTKSGVRMRLLNKMVKTLVLRVHEFGHPCFTHPPSSVFRNTAPLEKLHLMQRALVFLYKYYVVVGLHAPASTTTPDVDFDVETMVSVQDSVEDEDKTQTTHQTKEQTKKQTVYQSFKCVNITFRRLYENNRVFCHFDRNHPLFNLANMRQEAKFNPFALQSAIQPYVHPSMARTITSWEWHNAGYNHTHRTLNTAKQQP